MENKKLWKRIDIAEENRPLLCENDECYYAREFISRGGYEASEANQLITNFKISPKNINTNRWNYKIAAIEKFAEEISQVLNDKCIITYIPTSKHKEDPEYDSRFEETCKRAVKKNQYLQFEEPITIKQSALAAHYGGTRNVDDIINNYKWIGFSKTPDCPVIIIDDVLTQGSHFNACKSLIHKYYPKLHIIGLFWTKAISNDEDGD